MTWDIRSNIALRLWEFPRVLHLGPPSGGGLYLTVYPSSRPNTDTIYGDPAIDALIHYGTDTMEIWFPLKQTVCKTSGGQTSEVLIQN